MGRDPHPRQRRQEGGPEVEAFLWRQEVGRGLVRIKQGRKDENKRTWDPSQRGARSCIYRVVDTRLLPKELDRPPSEQHRGDSLFLPVLWVTVIPGGSVPPWVWGFAVAAADFPDISMSASHAALLCVHGPTASTSHHAHHILFIIPFLSQPLKPPLSSRNVPCVAFPIEIITKVS